VACDFLGVVKNATVVVYQIANLVRKCLPPHFPIVTEVSKDIGMLIMQLDFRLRSLPFKLAKSLRQLLLIPRDMVRFAGSVSTLVKMIRGGLSSRAAALSAPQLKRLDMKADNSAAVYDDDLVPNASECDVDGWLGHELGAAAKEATVATKEAEAVPEAPPAGMKVVVQDDEGGNELEDEEETAEDDDGNEGEDDSVETIDGADEMEVEMAMEEEKEDDQGKLSISDVEAPAPQSMARLPAADLELAMASTVTGGDYVGPPLASAATVASKSVPESAKHQPLQELSARVQSMWETPRLWAENVFAPHQPQLAAVVEDAVALGAAASSSNDGAALSSKPSSSGMLQVEALNASDFTERGSLLERSQARVFLTTVVKGSSTADGLHA